MQRLKTTLAEEAANITLEDGELLYPHPPTNTATLPGFGSQYL